MEIDLDRILARSFFNRERVEGHVLSGYVYVAAQHRVGALERSLPKILLARANKCGHLDRICEACAYSWSWDFILHFDRTEGGRQLRKRLVKSGQDLDAIMAGQAKRPTGLVECSQDLVAPPSGMLGDELPDERTE